MPHSLAVLTWTAATLGVVHTLIGPDHYVPFVMLSKARNWSAARTAAVTAACGAGHVLGSVVLGAVGIAAGVALARLEIVESVRSSIAAWLLITFGIVYGAWGLRHAIRGRHHRHPHTHGTGEVHDHDHAHDDAHAHVHDAPQARSVTPWILFIVFVFGPCEPLIPLLMFPAALESAWGVALVAGVFGLATVATMLFCVLLLTYGVKTARLGRLEPYSHALAGGAVALCGALVLAGF